MSNITWEDMNARIATSCGNPIVQNYHVNREYCREAWNLIIGDGVFDVPMPHDLMQAVCYMTRTLIERETQQILARHTSVPTNCRVMADEDEILAEEDA